MDPPMTQPHHENNKQQTLSSHSHILNFSPTTHPSTLLLNDHKFKKHASFSFHFPLLPPKTTLFSNLLPLTNPPSNLTQHLNSYLYPSNLMTKSRNLINKSSPVPFLFPLISTKLETPMDTQTQTEQKDIIFRSKLPDIYIPKHLPLHSYCFENISDFSSRPCLINGASDRVYTYSEVELTSRKVAAGLHKHGINQTETIMLLLPNCPEFIFAFLGASYIGAVSTTANPFFTSSEIIKQAKASKTKLIITVASNVPKVKKYAEENGVKIVCIDESIDGCLHFFSDLEDSDETTMPEVDIQPDDVVALPYSSGTTGLPKGVMLTHKGLVTSVAQQVDGDNANLYMHKEDVVMCTLPLFHIYSMNSILLCGLRVGSAILLMHKFDIVPFLELIQRFKVTIGPFVPPIVLAIAKSPVVDQYDLSSIRTVMSGAAPLGKDLENAVRAKLPNAKLGQGYGMTEAGPVLAMCLAFAKEPFEIKSGACGTVVRNSDMKIIDTLTGASLPRNQPGEICIRGDQIMKGYLNDPEATENTIDKEGWLHTGDIGYIDDDDELFIVDRLKELIKYKGFQVAPAELEALLLTHPNICDAAVVSMKDEGSGEVPVAFVVRSNGSTTTEDEIKQFVSKQVIFYKRINRVFFAESIPKSPAGKILRKDLRAKLASNAPTTKDAPNGISNTPNGGVAAKGVSNGISNGIHKQVTNGVASNGVANAVVSNGITNGVH